MLVSYEECYICDIVDPEWSQVAEFDSQQSLANNQMYALPQLNIKVVLTSICILYKWSSNSSFVLVDLLKVAIVLSKYFVPIPLTAALSSYIYIITGCSLCMRMCVGKSQILAKLIHKLWTLLRCSGLRTYYASM